MGFYVIYSWKSGRACAPRPHLFQHSCSSISYGHWEQSRGLNKLHPSYGMMWWWEECLKKWLITGVIQTPQIQPTNHTGGVFSAGRTNISKDDGTHLNQWKKMGQWVNPRIEIHNYASNDTFFCGTLLDIRSADYI